MAEKKEMITREEATRQVLSGIGRLALIHDCFSKSLVEELGEERGKEVIRKAIRLYGRKIGEKVREKTLAKGCKALLENYQEDLPALGWSVERVKVDGEPRARIYGCPLAMVWKELGSPELGRLYCYVDQAKYRAYNPDLECVHTRNVLDGDPYCEMAVRGEKGNDQN